MESSRVTPDQRITELQRQIDEIKHLTNVGYEHAGDISPDILVVPISKIDAIVRPCSSDGRASHL